METYPKEMPDTTLRCPAFLLFCQQITIYQLQILCNRAKVMKIQLSIQLNQSACSVGLFINALKHNRGSEASGLQSVQWNVFHQQLQKYLLRVQKFEN